MLRKRPVEFNVPQQYKIGDILGEGAYGVVCSAFCTTLRREVAIKKVPIQRRASTCLRTLREIKLLRHFQHENIVSLIQVLMPASCVGFTDVYLVQEKMPTDLACLLRSGEELTKDHFAYFTYQILRGLKAIHSAGILHRDLKPSNLLVNHECTLKICDFGLAREGVPSMTEYVATRWYRAPEIMLNSTCYTKAIDMWSVGCILAEMLRRRVLFPGKDYVDQVMRIFYMLGTPREEDYNSLASAKSQKYIRSLPPFERPRWIKYFPNADPPCLGLLEALLRFNPSKRPTAEEALAHPYLDGFHDPEDEPTAESVSEDLCSLRQSQSYAPGELERLLLEEILQG